MFIELLLRYTRRDSAHNWFTFGQVFPAMMRYFPLLSKVSISSSFNFVELDPQPSGTRIKRWKSKSSYEGIFIGLVMEKFSSSANPSVEFDFHCDMSSSDPILIRKTIEKVKQFAAAKELRVTNLKLNSATVLELDFERQQSNQEIQEFHFIEALATIVEEMGINISVPPTFTGKDLRIAEMVAEILLKGFLPTSRVLEIGSYMKFTANVEWARNALIEATTKTRIDHTVPGTTNSQIELLGHQLDLGPSEYLLVDLKMRDREEIRNQVEKATTEDEKITITFDVDVEHSFMRFINWPRDPDLGSLVIPLPQ